MLRYRWVIPLPLEEMILDWKVIEEPEKKDKKNIKVLLTGAPKTLVKKYVEPSGSYKQATIEDDINKTEEEIFS